MSTLSVTTIKSLTASTPPVIQDSAGTQIGTFCRAWVNFNGTGTVAIRAAFNVSSITDNGTGDYTANFSAAMPDADYSTVVSCKAVSGSNSTSGQINFSDSGLTTSVRLWFSSLTSSATGTDRATVNVAIFR